MRWQAYCTTCKVNLATQQPRTTSGLSGSMVETFAVYHLRQHPGHRVLIGYLFELVDTEEDIIILDKLEKINE